MEQIISNRLDYSKLKNNQEMSGRSVINYEYSNNLPHSRPTSFARDREGFDKPQSKGLMKGSKISKLVGKISIMPKSARETFYTQNANNNLPKIKNKIFKGIAKVQTYRETIINHVKHDSRIDYGKFYLKKSASGQLLRM